MNAPAKTNSSVWQRLLWKDAKTIRPLMLAVTVGVIAFNLFNLIAQQIYPPQGEQVESHFVTSYLLWVLMPNLMALGAPAILVGTEQESGTLDWMRTLPVSWQRVAGSKFVTAIIGTLLIWVLCSMILWLGTSRSGPSPHPFESDLRSLDGVLYLLFFSLTLLFCGFITSYLLRSPVAALIAVVPLVSMLTWFCNESARVISGSGSWGHTYSVQGLTAKDWWSVVFLGTATIGVLVAIATWLARRRLITPSRSLSFSLSGSAVEMIYQPPRNMVLTRPSPGMALLWQQRRQIAVHGLALLAVNAFFAVVYGCSNAWNTRRSFLAEFAPLVMMLTAGWLGCLVFYGDSVRRRCAYFADRGVSPTKVWWTRLVPVIFLGFAFTGMWWWASSMREESNLARQLMMVFVLVLFSCGQLVAMWLRRPTISFFAAPVYALLVLLPFMLVMLPAYESYLWTLLLIVPVLHFTTWYLTARWLDGRMDFGFHWQVISMTALAIFLPFAVIFGHRFSTTPAAIPQWRAIMFAEQAALFGKPINANTWSDLSVEIYPQADGINVLWQVHEPSNEDLARLHEELSDELLELRRNNGRRIGAFVSASHIYRCLSKSQPLKDFVDPHTGKSQDHFETQLQAIETLLRWARIIRTECAAGRQALGPLWRIAEPAEETAVRQLGMLLQDHPDKQELLDLVELIADGPLRKSSRTMALKLEWGLLNASLDHHQMSRQHVTETITFAGVPVLENGGSKLPLERKRSLRFLDLATSRTLEYLQAGLARAESQELDQLWDLWKEAFSGPNAENPSQLDYTLPRLWLYGWTSGRERMATELREKYLLATPTE